jgi:hypothetical protein
MSVSTRARRLVAAAIVAACGGALLAAVMSAGTRQAGADVAPPVGSPPTVSAVPLPTMQINGIVWAQVIVGNWVYATGDFTSARPPGAQPGTGEVTVGAIVRYNITTGLMDPTFIHALTGPNRSLVKNAGLALAASPDGSTVYVGGNFTYVDGRQHLHLAAFDNATGALDTSFTASPGGPVSTIVATAATVYVGGAFKNAASSPSAVAAPRNNLAAFGAASGALNGSWLPTTDSGAQVMTMVLTPDHARLVIGGNFATVDGLASPGMGSVDAVSGAAQPWLASSVIRDYGANSAIDILSVDGSQIYGGGYNANGGTGNLEGRFAANPSTGALNWIDDCHGDTYATLPLGSVLYSVGHDHDCSEVGSFPNDYPASEMWHRAIAESTTASGGKDAGPDYVGWNYSKYADASVLDWFPSFAPSGVLTTSPQTLPGTVAVSGAAEAAWSVVGNASYLAMGGEMTHANGTAPADIAQGLVRYAVQSITAAAPATVGPSGPDFNSVLPPTLAAGTVPGTVHIAIPAAWDRDSENLTYQLRRDDAPTPIYTVTVASQFWNLPIISYTDTGLAPGTHTYQFQVTDAEGKWVKNSASITMTGSPITSPAAVNLAAGKPTSQSSISRGGQPWLATDGNTDGRIADHSVALTGVNPSTDRNGGDSPGAYSSAWWQVDLGTSTAIHRITVYGDTDNPADSADLYVFWSNTPFDTRLTPAQQAAALGPSGDVYQQTTMDRPGGVTRILPAGTKARYVMVQHGPDFQLLGLGEVVVS